MLPGVCREYNAGLFGAVQHHAAQMIDSIELTGGHEGGDGQIGSWRVVASAWALVLLFSLLLAGVSAMACTHSASQPPRHVAHAVIPKHQPCGEAGVPSTYTVDGCKAASISEDRSAYW